MGSKGQCDQKKCHIQDSHFAIGQTLKNGLLFWSYEGARQRCWEEQKEGDNCSVWVVVRRVGREHGMTTAMVIVRLLSGSQEKYCSHIITIQTREMEAGTYT